MFVNTSLYNTIFLQEGNVGIGTETPLYPMDLRGDLHVDGTIGIGTDLVARLVYDVTCNLLRCEDSSHTPIYMAQGFMSKGDLLVYDGNKQVRLPIGTNEQVLSVNTTTSTGLLWKDPASVGVGTNLTLTELSVENITSINGENINLSNKTLSNVATLDVVNFTSPNHHINASAKTLSNVATLDVVNITSMNGENINLSNKTLSNVATLDVVNITGNASHINLSGKTLSNVDHIYASNIVYKEEPVTLLFDKVMIPYTTYTKVLHWFYEGNNEYVRKPLHMLVNAYLHTTCNETVYLTDPEFKYNIRIMDITHNTLLGNGTYSNSEPELYSILLNDIPKSNIDIEVQIQKGSNGTYAYIDNITMHFN